MGWTVLLLNEKQVAPSRAGMSEATGTMDSPGRNIKGREHASQVVIT